MLVFGRRNLLLGGGALAALSVTGCSGGGASGVSPDDMAIGNPDSGVTLIEYGSSMCSHCREFEETVFRQLQDQLHRHQQDPLHLPRSAGPGC